MAHTDIIQWLNKQLVYQLGFDDDSVEDISNYMISMTNFEEAKSYTCELLCGSSDQNQLNASQKDFLRELSFKWQRICVPNNVTVHKKNSTTNDLNNSRKAVGFAKSKKNPFDLSDLNVSPVSVSQSKKGKKKTSFVSLYGKDGKVKANAVIIPGRNSCECQAQKHKLVNNCLKCGRVVCEQEGSGPCLFCGELVCTKEEKEVLARKSNKSEKLRNRLERVPGGGALTEGLFNSDDSSSIALEKARAYKERLLNYDRTYAQRTKVIDDESDYYAADTNIWLNPKEKARMQKKEAEIREKRHGSRLNKKFTIDFAGREVTEDISLVEDSVIDDDTQDFSECFTDQDFADSYPDLVNPAIKTNLPMFVPTKVNNGSKPAVKSTPWNGRNRLQDKQLLEMSDPGMCLSMHQPWASLLVCGIKRDEGRSWYSSHRGRLWIAAAAKEPSKDEISLVEEQHRQHWQFQGRIEEMPEFPKAYPVGCLLGCVDVKDVLSQEDYNMAYPQAESHSAYVFVCDNPHELAVKFPTKGKHKIWRLDPKVHKAAKSAIVY